MSSHPTPIDGNQLDPLANQQIIKEKDSVSNSGSDEKDLNKEKDSDVEKGVSVNVKGVDSESMSTGEINYKTMSWQRCAALLFGEYVCLAILSFPYAFQTLGMAGGILSTLGLGIIALYTSLTLWKYCMKFPHLLHIADIGYNIFGKHWIAYELTAIALILNNVFIQGLHTLTGAEILNVLSEHGTCTVVFSVCVMLLCFLCTLPRKLEHVALMGIASAISMGIAIFLVLIFTGIQGRAPLGKDANEDVFNAVSNPVYITAWAPKGTTFIAGFNAFLNIVFTWVGQIMYPSFIAEMKQPEDFPKALYAVTIMEFIVFTIVGLVCYYYNGQFTGAPAVTNLKPLFKKIAFSFVFPTTVIIGVIYASVVAKFLFHRMFYGTRHFNNYTTLGWIGWVGAVLVTWVGGWIVGESIPFFGTLLSLMSALFDGFFGFIFWAAAYAELYRGQLWVNQSYWRKAETLFNAFLFLSGIFIFGPGLYTSVEAIKSDYSTGAVKRPFSCADNGV